MSKFDRTEPVAGSSVLSAPIRLNFQGVEEALLGASAKAQPSPDLTVKVEAFVYLGADGVTRRSYAGGNSPALVAPAANPRIALLQIDDTPSLTWKYGAEAASPSAPNPDAGKVSICEVFQRVGMTQTKDADDSTQGYIQRQASKIRAAGWGSGAGVPGADFFELGEIADPATPSADQLRVYAKDDGGGKTRAALKDAAARVLMLLGSKGVREVEIIRKTADETVNNSAALQNDDALLAALAANETVYFLCFVVHVGDGAADIKFAFTVPSLATMVWAIPNAAVSTGGALKSPDVTTLSGTAQSFGASTTTFAQLFIGVVRNSSTAGNLQLQWAQDVATVVDTKVLTDSFLMVWRV